MKNQKIKLFYVEVLEENEVLQKLQELHDEYHIICGVSIKLPYWVTYQNKKNLHSAQMYIIVKYKKYVST